MNTMKKLVVMGAAFAALSSFGAYNVRQPSDALKPLYKGVEAGRWTLDVDAALAASKADGKITILLNTGSWWCPFCETLEDMVLKTQAWSDFVAENEFNLAMMDFPYRNNVSAAQLNESWHPELGKGWGFKCWLMCPEFLAENGLTVEQGLDAIMSEYELQKSLALETASLVTISNWQQTAEFSYGKLGYPTILVFGPDGAELGRTSFPWSSSNGLTESEAQEYVFQEIEKIINGDCTLCEDPLAGAPVVAAAQVYNGWISSADGIGGLVEFKTTKKNVKGYVKVSGSVTIAGKKTVFKPATSFDVAAGTELTGKNASAFVRFGETGLTGTLTINGVSYEIAGGGRNVFKSKDDAAKTLAAAAPKDTWSVVLQPKDRKAPSPFALGYGSLSVKIAAAGKAKVSGTLGDGTKVSVSTQLIMGNNGLSCLPVLASLYGKQGGFGFIIWFKNGRLLNFSDVSPWISAGKNEFSSVISPMSTMSPGIGAVPTEEPLELTIAAYEGDEAEDSVKISRVKWTGDATALKATCALKTGLINGSMKLKNSKGAQVSAKFNGVVMGGSAYGTAVIAGEGSYAVKIAICGSCSD